MAETNKVSIKKDIEDIKSDIHSIFSDMAKEVLGEDIESARSSKKQSSKKHKASIEVEATTKGVEKTAKEIGQLGETIAKVSDVIDAFNKKGIGKASNKSAKTWFGNAEQIATAIKQQFKELETTTDKSKVERNIYNLGSAMQALTGDMSSLPKNIQKFWTSLDQRKKTNDFNGITVTVEQMKEAFAQLSSLGETDLGKINRLGENLSAILKDVEKQTKGGKTKIDPQPLLNIDEIVDPDKLDEAQRELKKRIKNVETSIEQINSGAINTTKKNLKELKDNMSALTDQLDTVKLKMTQIKKVNKSKENFMSWIPDDEYKKKKAQTFFDNVKSAVSKKDVKSIYDEYEKFFAQDDKWEIGPDIRTAANKVLKDLTGFSVGTKKGFDKAMEALNPEMFAERQSEVSKRLLDEQKAIFDDLTKGMADASAEMPENLKEYFQELRSQIEATEGSGKRMFDLFKKRQDDLNLTFDKQSSKWKPKQVTTKTKKTYNEQKRGDGSTKITSETTSTVGDRPSGTGENAMPPGTSSEIDTAAQTADRATDSVKSLSKALEFLGKMFEEVGGDQDKFIKKLQELNISKKELADLVNIAGFTDKQITASNSTIQTMRRMLAEGIKKTKSGDAAVIGKQSNQEQLRQYIIDNSKEGEAENNLKKYSKAIVAVTDDAESLSAAMLKVQKGMGIDIVDNGEIQEDIKQLDQLKKNLAEAQKKLNELEAFLQKVNAISKEISDDYLDASSKADAIEFTNYKGDKVTGPHNKDGTYDLEWLYRKASDKASEGKDVKAAAYYNKYVEAFLKQESGPPKALDDKQYSEYLLKLAKVIETIVNPGEKDALENEIKEQKAAIAEINKQIEAIENEQPKQEKPKAAQKQRQRKATTRSDEQKELNEEKANEPDTTAQSESETKARKKERESVESLKAALEALRQEKEKYIKGAGGGLDSVTKAALSNSRRESPDNTKMSSDYAERVRKSLENGNFDRAAAYYEGYQTTTMTNKDSRERFFDVNREDVTDRLAERAKAMTKYAIQVENKQGEIYKKIVEYDRKLADQEQKLEKAKLQEEKASKPKVRSVGENGKEINSVRTNVTRLMGPEKAEGLTTQEDVDAYTKRIQIGILLMRELGGNFEGLQQKYEEFKKALKIQPNEIGLDVLAEEIKNSGKTIQQAYEETKQRKSKKASQEKQEEQKQRKKQEPKPAPSEEKPKAEPKAESKPEQKPKTTPKKPETSGDLEEEIRKANDLKDALEKEIPAAIEKKNEAFTGEKNHVDSIIDAEIKKVRELAQVINEEIPESFEEQFKKIDELRESLDKIFNMSREEAAPEVPSLEKPIEETKELKTENNNIQQVGSQIVDNQKAISDSASKTNEVLKEQQVLMYHIGEMNKAGTQLTHGLGDEPSAWFNGIRNGGRGWGDGTGTYAVTNPQELPKIEERSNQKYYAIDVSDLKLYEAHTEESAQAFYEFIHNLEQFCYNVGTEFKGFDDRVGQLDSKQLYSQMKTVFPDIELTFEQFDQFIEEMIDLLGELKINAEGVPNAKALFNIKKTDPNDIKTRFLKMLGYQGTNFSGTSFDSIQSGNVLFDNANVKQHIIKQSKNLDDISYIQQQVQQQNEAQQEFKETGDAAESAGETVRRSQEEIQKEINETNVLLEEQERKLRKVEDASHNGAQAVVDPEGKKHATSDLKTAYDAVQKFKADNEYDPNNKEYMRNLYKVTKDYNAAYEKAVETGVAQSSIDRYFDHKALEDYFNILHKSYINWQARIDETKKKLAELNQELLDAQEPQTFTMFRGISGKANGDVQSKNNEMTFFTDSIENASGYAGEIGEIYKSVIQLKNAFVMDNVDGSIWNQIQYLGDGSDEASKKITSLAEKGKELIHLISKGSDIDSHSLYTNLFGNSDNISDVSFEGKFDEILNDMDNIKTKNDTTREQLIEWINALKEVAVGYREISIAQDNIYGTHSTDDFAKLIFKNTNHDGVVFKNIFDSKNGSDLSDILVTKSNNSILSSELVDKETVKKEEQLQSIQTQINEKVAELKELQDSVNELKTMLQNYEKGILDNISDEDIKYIKDGVLQDVIREQENSITVLENKIQELNNRKNELQNETQTQSEPPEEPSGFDKIINQEIEQLQKVKDFLEKDIPAAIEIKNKAFEEELQKVKEIVEAEINELENLKTEIQTKISESVENIDISDIQSKFDEIFKNLSFDTISEKIIDSFSSIDPTVVQANLQAIFDQIKIQFKVDQFIIPDFQDLFSNLTIVLNETLGKLATLLETAQGEMQDTSDTSEQTGEQMEQDQKEVQEEIEKTKRSIEELTEAYKKLLNVFNEAGGGTDAKNALIKSLSGKKFNLEELQRLASEITGASMDDLTGLTKKDLSTKIANQAQMNLLASTPVAQPEVSAEANKANEEYEELQKNIAQVRTEIETLKQSLSSLDEKFMLDSEADVFTQLVHMLEKVIPDAIEIKNEAFRNEVKVVEGVVEQEKEALSELEKAIRHVVEAINFKNVGLEDIGQITNVLQTLVKVLKPKPLEDFSTNLNTLIEQLKKFNQEVNVGEGTIFSSLQDILGRADELRDFANILDHTQEQINNAADAASGNTGSWKIVDIPLLDKNKWDNIINSANNLHDIVGDVVRITQQIRTNSRTGEQNISYRIAGDKADATVGANGHVLNTTANVYDREFNAQQDARLRVLSTLESELVESGQMTDDLRSRVNNLFDVLSETNPHSKFKDYDRQLDEFRKSLQEADEEANRFQRNWDAWLAVINRRSGEQMRSDFANAIDRLGPGQEDRFADYHDENGNWTGALQSVPFDNLLNKYKELEKQQNEYNKVLQQSFSSEHPEQYNEALNDILTTIERIKGELRDEVSESLLDSFNEKQLDELKNQLNKNDIAEARGNDIVANYKKKQDEKQAKDDKEAASKLEQDWKKAQAAIESYYKAAKRVKEIQDAIDAGERDENKYSTKMALSKARDQMQRARNRTIGVVDKNAIRDEQSKADYAEANRIFGLYGTESVDVLSQGFGRLENAANVYAKLTKEAEKYYKLIYKKQSGKSLSYNEKQYLEQMIPLYEKINKEADKYNDHLTEEERAKLPQDFKQAVVDARSKPLLDEYENIRQGIDSLGDMEQNSNLEKYLGVLELKYERIGKLISEIDWDGNSEQSEENIKKVTNQVMALSNEIAQASKNNKYIAIDDNDKASLKRRMAEWSQQNQAAKDAIVQIQKLQTKLENIDDKGSLDKIEAEFEDIKRKANEAGNVGKSFAQKLKGSFGNLARYLMSFAGFYEFVNVLRQGVAVVREMDTALTELRKVSDESLSSLKRYQLETYKMADAVGTSATQIMQSTADWVRLGRSLNDAKELAVLSTKLLNVSEFENINDATQSLVSATQAYKDIAPEAIVDKLNLIGNNFAISTDELATGLQNAAAVLMTQGNDLDEALALLTSGNVITQDISKSSAGIRTISLRIAGKN